MTPNFGSTYSLVDLGQFASALVMHAREARRRGLVFEAVSARLPKRWVMLPAREYRQLLNLLASYALAACKSGHATMVLDQTPLDETRLRCRVRVIDAREGLTAEERLRLNEPAVRAPMLVRDLPAELAPAAELAHALGGTLAFGLGPQGGEVLTLEFVCPAAATAGAPDAAPAREFRKLLLVDDNAINRFVVAEQLVRMGFEVTLAGDGAEALDIIDTEPFDFVLCDCDMPGMNGFDFTRTVRTREAQGGGHLVIIALTVDHSEQSRRDCLGAGMDGWLTKPIEPHRLQEIFEQLRHGA